MEENQEYYVFKLNIPQYIQVLRNSHPELNTDKWVERVDQIEALFGLLKYMGFRGESLVEESDTDSMGKNYLEVEPVVFEADHGSQPDEDLKNLVDADPELRNILGYDHPFSGVANLMEKSMLRMLEIFQKRKDEIVHTLRDAVAAETDLSKINESIQRFETALVYNELAGFYKPIKQHLQSRFDFLIRARDIRGMPHSKTCVDPVNGLETDSAAAKKANALARWFTAQGKPLVHYLIKNYQGIKKTGPVAPAIKVLLDDKYLQHPNGDKAGFVRDLTCALDTTFTRQGLFTAVDNLRPNKKDSEAINSVRAEIIAYLKEINNL